MTPKEKEQRMWDFLDSLDKKLDKILEKLETRGARGRKKAE